MPNDFACRNIRDQKTKYEKWFPNPEFHIHEMLIISHYIFPDHFASCYSSAFPPPPFNIHELFASILRIQLILTIFFLYLVKLCAFDFSIFFSLLSNLWKKINTLGHVTDGFSCQIHWKIAWSRVISMPNRHFSFFRVFFL